MVECAGRIDLEGIMKAVQSTDFMLHRLTFQVGHFIYLLNHFIFLQELVLSKLNAMEAETGRIASVIYIIDLDELKLHPSLISIVTGQCKVSASFNINYL